MKQKKLSKNQRIILRIFFSLLLATVILYALIGSAKLSGASYNITHGEYFITWSVLSVLSLLSINNFYKK